MLNEAEAVNIAFCIRVRVTTSLCWLFIVRVACWHSFFRFFQTSRVYPRSYFPAIMCAQYRKLGRGWKALFRGLQMSIPSPRSFSSISDWFCLFWCKLISHPCFWNAARQRNINMKNRKKKRHKRHEQHKGRRQKILWKFFC